MELIDAHARKMPMRELLLGCPLNNLAQEMSPLDGGFRAATGVVFERWLDAIASAIGRGQKTGRIRRNVAPREAATAVLALFEGGVSLTKNAQDGGPLVASARAVRQYLTSLAPTPSREKKLDGGTTTRRKARQRKPAASRRRS